MMAGETVMVAGPGIATVTVTIVVTEIAQETGTGLIRAIEGNGVLRHTTTATSEGVQRMLHRRFMRRNHYGLGVPGIMEIGIVALHFATGLCLCYSSYLISLSWGWVYTLYLGW
jgi:hypothetical protein